MNKRIRKKKQAKKPDLQTAWNVVAEHLKKDGEITHFISGNYTEKTELEIYTISPNRTIIKSTLNN